MLLDIIVYLRVNNVKIYTEKLPNSLLFKSNEKLWHIYTVDILKDTSQLNLDIFLIMCKKEVIELIGDDEFVARLITKYNLIDNFNSISLKYNFENTSLHYKINMLRACE